jgi:toxin ParE1/3/4
MGDYNVKYLPLAYEDLDNIFDYVAAESRQAAQALLDDIDTVISHLNEFSNMGVNPKNQRLSRKGYRIVVVNQYLVFYAVAGNTVEIRRILSSKRNYENLLT